MKPLLLGGVLLLTAAGTAGALHMSTSGGEEEVAPAVQATATTATAVPTPTVTRATAVPTTGPLTTIAPCPPQPTDAKPYISPSGTSKAYEDQAARYSLRYSDNWTVCSVPSDPQIRDLLSATRFLDQNGLVHASVYVFSNPKVQSLEDWVADHDPIFLDHPPEERTIAGARALYSPTSADGLPAPSAYFAAGQTIFGVSGLKVADFDVIVTDFRLSEQG
jgi:hypothetical protein